MGAAMSEKDDTLAGALEMVGKLDQAIRTALHMHAPGDLTMPELLKRCRFVKAWGLPYETLYYDDRPLLDVYPMEMEQRVEGDRVVMRFTQKIRHLHPGDHANG